MRSILSLKKSRKVLAREDASGDSGVSLRDFDEKLCLGFSRVCEDWQMIRLQDWTKMRIWLWK